MARSKLISIITISIYLIIKVIEWAYTTSAPKILRKLHQAIYTIIRLL